jgi:hypothetical protein
MKFAQRTSHLKSEGAYQVLARAQALETTGKAIIHFEWGVAGTSGRDDHAARLLIKASSTVEDPRTPDRVETGPQREADEKPCQLQETRALAPVAPKPIHGKVMSAQVTPRACTT